MHASTCIFCQIVAGELACSKIYEDDRVIAFLDIQPIRPGQALVIPKEHIDHFSDLPDDLAGHIFAQSHRISREIRAKLNPARVGLVVHGYGVAHAHMIIVPQHDEHDITSARYAKVEGGKLIFSVRNIPLARREELDRIAALLE